MSGDDFQYVSNKVEAMTLEPHDEPLGYSVQEGSTDHVYTDNLEAPEDTVTADNAPLSDEDIFKMLLGLEKEARTVLSWYWGDPTEDLALAAESEHEPYYKVGIFQSIAEMKSATDEVFTPKFAETNFYGEAFVDRSGGDTPMYKEIDGELYRNVDIGGFGWTYTLTNEYYIPYQDDSMIVIAVQTLLPGGELEWHDFLLRKVDGAWKIETFYDMNPHMGVFPRQIDEEILHAVSSWFCVEDWTDANQLDANALINFYMYAYLSETEEYDDEKGYEVSSAKLMEGLSVYLNGLKKETLTAVNQNEYANARYDETTDNFYFDIMFDPAEYVVVNSETEGAVTTLEIMVIGKSGKASYTSFLDLEVDGSDIKFVGNRSGEDFAG
jgi:hypothetical protein